MSVMPDELGGIMQGLGGGAPAGPPPEEAPDLGSAITSPGKGDNSDNLRNAAAMIQTYLEGESDDEDIAEGTKIAALIANLLAKQQKLEDTAVGAGPGAKLVRKSRGGGGASAGY